MARLTKKRCNIDYDNIGVKPNPTMKTKKRGKPKRKFSSSLATSVVSNEVFDTRRIHKRMMADPFHILDSMASAQDLVESGQYFVAEQMFKRLNVPEKEAFSRIADICFEKKFYETAANYYMKAEQFEKAGETFLALGRFFAAGKCFQKTDRRRKAHHVFHRGGLLALEQENYGLALECFKRCDKKDLMEKTKETMDRLSRISMAKLEAARQEREKRTRGIPLRRA